MSKITRQITSDLEEYATSCIINNISNTDVNGFETDYGQQETTSQLFESEEPSISEQEVVDIFGPSSLNFVEMDEIEEADLASK